MLHVYTVGAPAPFWLAVEQELKLVVGGDLQFAIYDPDAAADCRPPFVFAVHCDSEERWTALAKLAQVGPAVAMVETVSIELYRRAARVGAGAVLYDNLPSILADVLVAASRLEALVPLAVFTQLATDADEVPPVVGDEVTMLRMLAQGETVASVACELAYSERTIRRRLHGLHLKLGTTDRRGLLDRARELGLLDASHRSGTS